MALSLSHPHPQTISENFMISVVGIAVAALAAFGVYQIVDTNTQADTNPATQVEPFSPELARNSLSTNGFSPELARANAVADSAFSPELARAGEGTTAVQD